MKRAGYAFLFLYSLFFATLSSSAQDTLPKFMVRNAGNNRIIVGWVNPFPTISQISIQRSFDSLKNYKTISTAADPKAIQNGFTDTKAPNDHMFYRLFYVLEGGSFFFTKPLKPDTSRSNLSNFPKPVIGGIDPNRSDTLVNKQKPVIKRPDWEPSYYVYTNKDGYVFINLPNADQERYSIKFFEEDNSPLFELKSVKEKGLILDKANFIHAGWFNFELYNGEKLVERNKFYLSKAFAPNP
ncbi:MAG: hypothetical protein JWP88_160 [Flaviaesturariibacter sp.]|nr:hypothetical protein [Flaviaesturariibacter sp.]